MIHSVVLEVTERIYSRSCLGRSILKLTRSPYLGFGPGVPFVFVIYLLHHHVNPLFCLSSKRISLNSFMLTSPRHFSSSLSWRSKNSFSLVLFQISLLEHCFAHSWASCTDFISHEFILSLSHGHSTNSIVLMASSRERPCFPIHLICPSIFFAPMLCSSKRIRRSLLLKHDFRSQSRRRDQSTPLLKSLLFAPKKS